MRKTKKLLYHIEISYEIYDDFVCDFVTNYLYFNNVPSEVVTIFDILYSNHVICGLSAELMNDESVYREIDKEDLPF